MIPAAETQKPESNAKKWRKTHYALDAGEGRVVTIVARPSLDRFQAQPIWEMSGDTNTSNLMLRRDCVPVLLEYGTAELSTYLPLEPAQSLALRAG